MARLDVESSRCPCATSTASAARSWSALRSGSQHRDHLGRSRARPNGRLDTVIGIRTQLDGAAYQAVARMWTPNAAAFKSLGQVLVDDPWSAAAYDKIASGRAPYYRDAMAVYADNRLS